MDTVNKVDSEIEKSLDLVYFTRRLRTHGFGLSLVLKEKELMTIGDASEKKDIRDIDNESTVRWRQFESFSFSEMVLVNMLRKERN
jgi:hypothetical protein